jgi:hypothetical protein
MFAITAIAVLALSGSGFLKKPVPAATPTSARTVPATPAQKAKAFDTNIYYWFSAFDDSYNDYETTAWEIWEMEIYYDVTVNTNPAGGTLIEQGYWNNSDPHEFPSMVFLYGHF